MGCNDLVVNNSCSTQLEHTRYFSRQLITADDLTQDQNYYREKRRMHNRLLHGWGIVCGLEVKQDAASPMSLIVTICSGYALSPHGDEIFLPVEVKFDISRCVKGSGTPCPNPCGSVVSVSNLVSPTEPFYIAIRYTECVSHPVRVPPIGCGCDDTGCEYSRIRDGYELTCKSEEDIPKTYFTKTTKEEIIGNLKEQVMPCAACLDFPWVVLALVTLEDGKLKTIDNSKRRILLSTAALQSWNGL